MPISESELGGNSRIAFLMLGHDVPPDGPVLLDDLAGGTGRLDVLIRGLQAGLLTSHGLRQDVSFEWLLTGGEERRWRWMKWVGRNLRRLSADERSIAGHVRGVLSEKVARNRWTEHTSGIFSRRGVLADVLESWKSIGRRLMFLERDGPALQGPTSELGKIGLILSDHRPFTTDEIRLLSQCGATPASVSSRWLQGNSAIAIALSVLDGDTVISSR